MPADTFPEMAIDEMSTAVVDLPFHHRVRIGISSGENWLQLVRFGCVGCSGFVVNVVAFWLCLHALGLDYKVADPIAYLGGVINNFYWNRKWTFGHKRDAHPAQQGWKFLVVSAVAFGCNYGLVIGFVHWTSLQKTVCDIFANILVIPVNFLGQKFWSFRD